MSTLIIGVVALIFSVCVALVALIAAAALVTLPALASAWVLGWCKTRSRRRRRALIMRPVTPGFDRRYMPLDDKAYVSWRSCTKRDLMLGIAACLVFALMLLLVMRGDA